MYVYRTRIWHFFVPNTTTGVGDGDKTLAPVSQEIQGDHSWDGHRNAFPHSKSTQLTLRVGREDFLEEVQAHRLINNSRQEVKVCEAETVPAIVTVLYMLQVRSKTPKPIF